MKNVKWSSDKIQDTRNNHQTNPNIQISITKQETSASGNQDIRKSGTPDHPISRYPDTPVHRFTDSPIPRFPGSRRRGFTLLELMVVVIIMGIVSTTVFLSSRGFLNKAAVKNATRDIASVMRIAHSKAGALKIKYYLVVFDNQEPPVTQARVWVQDPRGPDGQPGIAGVDDDGDGRTDEWDELGTPGSDDFDASDSSTWKTVFGTERRLSKRVEIASVFVSYPTDNPHYGNIDDPCQIGYLPFYWKGTSVSGSVRLQDTKGNNPYKVLIMQSSSRVTIEEGW